MKKSNTEKVIKLFDTDDIKKEMMKLNKKDLSEVIAELSGKQLDGILAELKLARYGLVSRKVQRIINKITELKEDN